jgi:hypothetical protein
MKAYCNRATKIADGQYDDRLDCGRVTKVKCKSSLKKRILRPFKKSERQRIKRINEDISCKF